MKNKFKALLAAFVGLFAFSAVAVGVNAETISFYNVNGDKAETTYAKNTELTVNNSVFVDATKVDNEVLTLNCFATNATVLAAAALGSYTQGLHYNSNSSASKCFRLTNTTNSSLKVTVDIAARDTKKFVETTAYFGETSATTSTTAVTTMSTNINAGETVNLYAASRRIVLYNIMYETGVKTHNVMIKDTSENLITNITVEDNKTLDYIPSLPTIDSIFDGYYLESTCTSTSKYDVKNPITEDIILYANFSLDSTYIVNNENLLDNYINKYMYNKFGDGNPFTNDLLVSNTIFTVLNGCKMQTTNTVECIGTTGSVDTTKQAVKIEVPNNGYISALVTTAGTSARNAKLIDSTGAEVTVSSGNAAWTATGAAAYERRTLGYEVGAGTYYLGGDDGMRILSVEFVPQEVTPLVQTAVVDTYTYVRFVSIVKGVEEFSAADITFKLTLTSGESNQEVTVTPYVVKKITSAGETYTAKVNEADYSFANHTAEYYVVYVVRFTTAKYTGDSIKATLTYAGNDYTSSVVTI